MRKRKKAELILLSVLSILILIGGIFIGYNLSKSPFYCHVDKVEVDDLYSMLGHRVGDHYFGRFVFENTTVRQIKNIYDDTYPMSNGVLEWELTQICDS